MGVARNGYQQQQKRDGFPEHVAVYGSLKGVLEKTLLVAGRCALTKIRRKSRVRHENLQHRVSKTLVKACGKGQFVPNPRNASEMCETACAP